MITLIDDVAVWLLIASELLWQHGYGSWFMLIDIQ
jgi:hypothetical protein